MIKRKFEGDGDVAYALDLILSKEVVGIEMADKLSIEHIRQSIESLEKVRDSKVTNGT